MKIAAYLKLMRFHKPVGIYLLLWPTLWALWVAGEGRPSFKNVIILGLGVVVMRAAGCIINDFADRDIDKHVKRTAMRPLATGEVNLIDAFILLIILLLIALVLVLQLNTLCFKLALIALFLACFYPFTKRFIYWPQLVLGFAFSMSVLMAFAAEINAIPLKALLIYVVAVLWPLMYDTQYAMVDREDDIKIGVKSTAILLGRYDVMIVTLLQLILVFLIGMINIFSALLIFPLFIYQYKLIRKREPDKCLQAFLNNQWVGLLVFIPLFLDYGHYFQ
jgi:4-hydroxybenzoate polyprenyltransferase